MAEELPLADYYTLIGVAGNATPEEVRRVYGERVREVIGDAELFGALNEAFETLKDPARRAAYDRQLRLQAQAVNSPTIAPVMTGGTRMNDNPTMAGVSDAAT
jgi:curved DNA-binding protein CbpA